MNKEQLLYIIRESRNQLKTATADEKRAILEKLLRLHKYVALTGSDGSNKRFNGDYIDER